MYKLKRTQQADNQLSNIIYYVADSSGSVDTAMKLTETIEKSLLGLTDFPESGVKPKYAILDRQGLRVLIVDRYLIFYKIDFTNETIIIVGFVSSSQEYINLI